MYLTDRRQTASSLYAPPIRGGGIIMTVEIYNSATVEYTIKLRQQLMVNIGFTQSQCTAYSDEKGPLILSICAVH